MTNTIEELMLEIAEAFHGELEGAASGTLTVQMIVDYAELEADSFDGEGKQTTFALKQFLHPLFEKLREAMYKAAPNHGAWYTAKLTIDSNGKYSYDFDYEDTTKFSHPPTPKELAEDLKHFPRAGK